MFYFLGGRAMDDKWWQMMTNDDNVLSRLLLSSSAPTVYLCLFVGCISEFDGESSNKFLPGDLVVTRFFRCFSRITSITEVHMYKIHKILKNWMHHFLKGVFKLVPRTWGLTTRMTSPGRFRARPCSEAGCFFFDVENGILGGYPQQGGMTCVQLNQKQNLGDLDERNENIGMWITHFNW